MSLIKKNMICNSSLIINRVTQKMIKHFFLLHTIAFFFSITGDLNVYNIEIWLENFT